MTGETDSAVERGAMERGSDASYAPELDRLTQLVEALLAEHEHLLAENRRLQGALAEVSAGKLGREQIAQFRAQLEHERRQWNQQREAIADRLEAILGKFQWLEAEQDGRRRPQTDS